MELELVLKNPQICHTHPNIVSFWSINIEIQTFSNAECNHAVTSIIITGAPQGTKQHEGLFFKVLYKDIARESLVACIGKTDKGWGKQSVVISLHRWGTEAQRNQAQVT